MRVFVFVILFSLPVFAQISPGKLSLSHSKLEGISNCTKCHVLGVGVEESKCLSCHKPIKKSIESKKGYHSNKELLNKKCWSCHSEHHGRKFRIINFDQNKFDHKTTGFKLTGKHNEKECSDCHKSEFITDLKLKKKKKTFLGLKTNCISCHEDVHQNTLGNDCTSCHNTIKFKPAEKFNHEKTKFKLSGKHKKVECIKCHKKINRNGKKFQIFKGVKFSSCSSCHKDPHKGSLGNDCKSCHVTSSFKKFKGKTFNHSKTKFPLIGKHQNVKCNDCHKNGIKNKLKFALCTDCHSDFHKGEFIKNNKQTDCSNCHTEEGFNLSNFDIDQHNKTRFQLTGSHLAVSCNNCHKKNKDWHFKNIGKDCIDCHKNIHGNELKKKFIGNNDCTKCHETRSWNTILFNHERTEFKLEGKHKKVNCEGCHTNKEISSKVKFLFASVKSDCENCHNDIHFGQFKENGSTNCQSCHTFNNWKVERFNHEKTRFSLKGSHEKLPCSACHKTVTVKGNKFIKFKLESYKCAACHS